MRESTMWATNGGPIIGEIKNGKKYPFGTVPASQYEDDQQIINARLSELNTAVTAAEANVQGLTTSIETLSQLYSSTVPGLSDSVSEIRTTLAALSTSLTSLSNAVNALTPRVAAAENSIVTDEQNIAAIQAVLPILENNITSLTSEINDLKNRMSTLEVGMATLRQQLLNSVYTINNQLDLIVTDKAAIKASLQALITRENAFEAEMTNAVERLNERVTILEHGNVPLEIVSFTASPNVCEIGGTENVILSWEVQGIYDSITINGDQVTGTSMTVPNVQEPTTFTMAVTDWKGHRVTKTITVSFANHVFWGASSTEVPNEGTVKSLDNSELSNERTRVFEVSTDNEYIYYCYPKRLGTSEFEINGFVGGFEDPAVIAIDNHSEYEEDYYVYRSANKISGTFTVHVI